MKATSKEREAFVKILQQVPLSEDSFIWYILNCHIHLNTTDNVDVLSLMYTNEMNDVREALRILFNKINAINDTQLYIT